MVLKKSSIWLSRRGSPAVRTSCDDIFLFAGGRGPVTFPAFQGFVNISLHSAQKRSKAQNTGFQGIYLVCRLAHERTLGQNSAIL